MPNGDWQEKTVPLARCDAERQRLKDDGWEVEEGCPADPEDAERCIVRYRRNYSAPPPP